MHFSRPNILEEKMSYVNTLPPEPQSWNPNDPVVVSKLRLGPNLSSSYSSLKISHYFDYFIFLCNTPFLAPFLSVSYLADSNPRKCEIESFRKDQSELQCWSPQHPSKLSRFFFNLLTNPNFLVIHSIGIEKTRFCLDIRCHGCICV